MRVASQVFFSFFLILSSFTCEALHGDIQKVNIHKLELEKCLLPKDHPLQGRLKALFENSHMFESNDQLKQAGFHPFNKRSQPSLMVASHPAIKGYLIKKFKNEVPQDKQLDNYLDRISGAKALRKFIKVNKLQHIVVPQKWLYRLPKSFADLQTGERTYILIVEHMDICNGGNNPNGTVGTKYHNMDFDILRELCIVLYYFRGLDSSLRNMPFTHQNTIAFVDTEKWWDKDREGFLRRAISYLSQDRQEYALAVFEELRKTDRKFKPN